MGVGVIDFTDLTKRGIIKKEETTVQSDVMDMTSALPAAPIPESPQPSIEGSTFDFLDSFSQLGSSNVPQSSLPVSSNNDHSMGDIHTKLDTITNKLEDTMYKIETLISRIMQLETRFDSLNNRH